MTKSIRPVKPKTLVSGPLQKLCICPCLGVQHLVEILIRILPLIWHCALHSLVQRASNSSPSGLVLWARKDCCDCSTYPGTLQPCLQVTLCLVGDPQKSPLTDH